MQRAIEKSMLRIILQEHIQNEVIQEWSRENGVISEYWKHKFHCTGQAVRFPDKRWTLLLPSDIQEIGKSILKGSRMKEKRIYYTDLGHDGKLRYNQNKNSKSTVISDV